MLNLDVATIQEYRWRINEETTTLETDGYNFVYSTATERSKGGIGLLIAEKISRHILHMKSISYRLMLVTIDCNPKITIICAYVSDTDTFYKNLNNCLFDITLHIFIVLMGDLNTRAGSSDTQLKVVGRYAYH